MLLKLGRFVGKAGRCSIVGNKSPNVRRGYRYRIDSLKDPYSELSQKLLSMGLVQGAIIEVVNVAPLGDPVQIRTQGYHVSLRLNELFAMNLTLMQNSVL